MRRGSAASDLLRLGGALLLGSIPVSDIISRATTGQDLRYAGTGTMSPSNLYQVGGIGPFAAGAALLAGGIAVGYVAGDTAPACFVTQLLLVPVLAAAQGRRGALLGLATATPMLAKRLLGNSPIARGHLRQTYVMRMIYDRDARFGRRGGRYHR